MKKLQLDKETELMKELIEINKSKVAKIDEDLKTIEERFKVLMEKETSALMRERTTRIATIESMENILSVAKSETMQSEVPATPEEAAHNNQESKKEAIPEESKDAEPVIQDTLFPENNEPETETETQTESETESAPEPTEEQTEPLSESDAVSTDEEGFSFGNEENEQEASDDDDNWPDMPTEWQ